MKPSAPFGSQQRRRHQAADASVEDALGSGEPLVRPRVEHQRRHALVHDLVDQALRVADLTDSSRLRPAGCTLVAAVPVLEENRTLLRFEVLEGSVENQVEQLARDVIGPANA